MHLLKQRLNAPPHQRSGRRRERGQSLVELAISMTVLMWIIVGVLDIGRLYMTYVAVQNAAAEGALYAAIHPTWVDTCPVGAFGCTDPAIDTIVARVRHEAPQGTMIVWDDAEIAVSAPNGTAVGQTINVELRFEYEMMTPILSNIWPSVMLVGHAEQLIMGRDN